MAIRSSNLNRRIKLQQRSTAVDSFGGQSTAWTDVTTVWGQLEELTEREMMAAAAVQSAVTHKLVIRYQPQFADPKKMAAMRATLTKDSVTRIFNIHGSADQDEKRRFLELTVEEGLNDG